VLFNRDDFVNPHAFNSVREDIELEDPFQQIANFYDTSVENVKSLHNVLVNTRPGHVIAHPMIAVMAAKEI